MPPAAPDDLIRQHSRSLEDGPSIVPEQTRTIPEHESSGRSKKKKNGKKAKTAKAATETTPEDLYVLISGATMCIRHHFI